MSNQVKCATCGFLAVRHFQTRALMDAEHELRTSGSIRHIMLFQGRQELVYEEYPVCFAQEINFRDNVEMGAATNPAKRAECINKERICAKHTDWRQGFTPKEHQEMIWLKEEQAANRQWRDQQAQREHTWRQEDMARDREWRNEDRSLAMSNLFVACGVGIVSAIVTLIAAKLLPWFSVQQP